MDRKPPVLSRRLSGVDAAFLYLERKEIPLNIAAVGIFDGPIPFREFVANIDSKLDLVPRYRQVAVPPPFNLGHPTWEFDPHFDITRHILRVQLDAPGGEAELQALASRLLSQMLDRGKPLWEIHVVDGLHDGRGALIVRIHHALADGVAGAALLRILFDPTPEASRATRPHPVPPPVEHTLAEQIAGAIQGALESAVAAEAGLLSLADGLLSDRGKGALQELTTLLPELLQPPERFAFNKPCSGDRKFCWTEIDFNEVQAIRAALGGKVNDCILSVVVRAISRYIRLHGEKVDGRFLRVVCPVNLRGDEQGESLGNRITFLPVVLPLDVRDPVEMLHAVSTRMEIMKSVRAAELVAIFASFLGTTPAPVQELFWRGLPLVPLPLPLLNVICTNVPGSPSALYTVGRRLIASYPCRATMASSSSVSPLTRTWRPMSHAFAITSKPPSSSFARPPESSALPKWDRPSLLVVCLSPWHHDRRHKTIVCPTILEYGRIQFRSSSRPERPRRRGHRSQPRHRQGAGNPSRAGRRRCGSSIQERAVHRTSARQYP